MSGADAADQGRFSGLAKELGVEKEKLESADVKNILRNNTEAAAKRGVFGVPTFDADGELFWGADSIEFLKGFLKDSSVVKNQEMQRLDSLPVAAARRIS
jgi:2-hydroxychromene-2-carboxylate isomerase